MNESPVIAMVRQENPCTEDARVLLDELSALIALYCADGAQSRFHIEDVQTACSAFAVARTIDGYAIGCGALRRFSFEVAEFKRIYRRPEWSGAGSVILRFLENLAARLGYRRIVLETREGNRRAVAFFLRHGYGAIDPFGEYIGMRDARCFGKQLADAQSC